MTDVGQLFLGPLSDQLGRFRVILLSAILFIIGSVLCAFAIIRDAFSGKTNSMVYSFINAIISVSPIIGPLIGVQLAINFHWQSAFVFLTMLAIIAFLIVVIFEFICQKA